MKLIVDEGNTRIKLALFNAEDELMEVSTSGNWQDVVVIWMKQHDIKQVLCAGVGSRIDEVEKYLQTSFKHVVRLKNASSTQIPNTYQSLDTLGVDRLANAAYAHYTHQWPALIVDCGTCLKFDVVDESGTYLGGAISPGLNMRSKAMHEYTNKLPLVEPSELLPALIGQNTKQSLLSGSHLGILHEIEQTITRYRERFSNLNIFLTGGDADYFVKALKNNIFADPFLTLKGLNEILKHS